MTHFSESDLALYAAGDLPWLSQWRAERHVRRCSECQRTVAGYSEFRSLPVLTGDPAVLGDWRRLSQEMRANIRLGLAAGECVGVSRTPPPSLSGTRLAIAGGFLIAAVAAGAWLNRPFAGSLPSPAAFSGTVLEASDRGIQVRGIRQTLRILNPSARNVVYTVGAQGELRARSLDPETGNVAITHVYGE